MPNDSNTESNYSAASPLHTILRIPRTKKRYKLSGYHCAMQLTDKEIFLYPVGKDGWIGAMQFIVDNSPHKEGLKVLAGLELA